MDAIRFCHEHHACAPSLAWIRQWNEAHGKKMTLLEGFDLCGSGRWKTWAWCRCARRHNIINVFNLLDWELALNQLGTLNPDDANDSLVWAMAEKCAVIWHMRQSCYPVGPLPYCEKVLGMTCAITYDNICNAMQGKVSEIIYNVGRADVEAYDRDHI